MRFGLWRALTFCILILSGVGVSGCTRPYDAPKLELTWAPPAMGSHIRGLIDQAQKATLKVIWTHGVCSTDVHWVVNRALLVKAALGPGTTINGSTLDPDPRTLLPVAGITPKGLSAQSVFIYKLLFESGSHAKLATYFVLWSPIDNPNRAELAFDSGDTVHTRAYLNGQIKEFFDGCLVDAVAYSGENGPIIRDGVRQAIAFALDQKDSNASPQPLAYVAESIGSKILFDTINEQEGNAAFMAKASQFDYFFMLANQIPILDQAGIPTANPPTHAGRIPSIKRFLMVTRPRRAEREGSEVLPTIVNFFDPNDILSYDIPSSVVGGAARLINVGVSNDDTWFWFLELPNNAHCGYGWNQSVINIVTNGDPNKGAKVPETILNLACSG